jgi:hypothetical protein
MVCFPSLETQFSFHTGYYTPSQHVLNAGFQGSVLKRRTAFMKAVSATLSQKFHSRLFGGTDMVSLHVC